MYRILRILNRFNLGGPVYNAGYLSADLAPEFTTVLLGGPPEAGEASSIHIALDLGVDARIIEEMRRSIDPLNDRKAYRAIRTAVRTFKPHIVHTHASKAGALGRLAAIHERVPVILHTFHGHVFHSYFGRLKTGVYKRLERSLAQRSSAIVAISDRQRHELCDVHRVAPAEKTHVIQLGFDLRRFSIDREQRRMAFRARYGVDDGVFAIGIVGRLAPVKNHRMFLDAAALLKQRFGAGVRFFIIGDGDLHGALHAHAQHAGLSTATLPYHRDAPHHAEVADVVFTSWVHQVEEVLPGLDAVALSSFNEGTPVSLIEAQAAGVPVVATDAGGVADVVLNTVTGCVTPSGNTAAFADALAMLITDPQAAARMSAAGQPHALAHFSRDRLASDMRALYLDLLAAKGL